MSRQLSLSAAFSVLAMTACALFATCAPRVDEKGAPAMAVAPVFEASLTGF
jgi:hypothetical protein